MKGAARRMAILGFGREGKSVLEFLKKSPQLRGDKIEILDKKFSRNYLKNLRRFSLIFRSPGVPYNLPELVRARRHGVRFSSATKLFFERCPTKNIIGVTGTKGKGTTSTLLYKMLKAAGFDVYLAGNIGKPAIDLLPRLKKNSRVILELSSFQLHDLEVSPHIAVILDVFPDHQDAHFGLREYYEAKANIAKHQKRGDKIFYFRNSPKSAAIARKSRGKKIAISEAGWKLFAPEDLKIPGRHNFRNAVMAASAALALGAPKKVILKTVKNFRGLPHRLELARVMRAPRGLTRISTRINADKNIGENRRPNQRESAAIAFYDDSASTNPHTTAAAVKAFSRSQESGVRSQGSLILIAGGQDKGLDYRPLARALKPSNTKLVVLYGENKWKIAKAIRRIAYGGLQIAMKPNLKSSMQTAYKFARRYAIGHELPAVILFSPGAASFDQFKNYADRGEQFKKIVKGLK